MGAALDRRCGTRTLSSRWRLIVDSHFSIRRYPVPKDRCFCVDFEVDRSYSKDTYCFRHDQGFQGTVGFLNWSPLYYRSNLGVIRRDRLLEEDTLAVWRLAMREKSLPVSSPSNS